jgi:hypothetical protein
MQNPTEQAETSIPTTETVMININGPNNMSGTLRRKAAKRTESWYNRAPPQKITIAAPVHLSPVGEEDITPARKKARLLEKPLPTTTTITTITTTTTTIDEAARKTASSPDIWTPEEDAKLFAVMNTRKKKHGEDDRIYWFAIADLLAYLHPGRTSRQCKKRWYDYLKRSIDGTTRRTGAWAEDEDIKLEDAVKMHGGKDWLVVSTLVPGRTKAQCYQRWKDVVDASIDGTTGRTGTWTEDEDIKLKDAVQMHGGKNWIAIAALVPGRTKSQCNSR